MTTVTQQQMSFAFPASPPQTAPAEPMKTKRKTVVPKQAATRSKPPAGKTARKKPARQATAETMAKQQREISISEFFAKNRHLLGFDNKRKALLTAVKEAVDNSLDACEEAGILPELYIGLTQVTEDRFRVLVRDNGPGIVRQQIPNVFGKLLYGSKFHRLKMARGQQGIGISAAGMYGLITTGKPISIISRTSPKADAHHFKVAIDTQKNRPDVVYDKTTEVPWEHGTQVEIEMVASFVKGRQGVGEYIEQTAIANPHAQITYTAPTGERQEFARGIEELPIEPREIRPHPYGIELGTMMKMLKGTQAKQLGAFLQKEFSRVSPTVVKSVCDKAGVTPRTWVNAIDSHAVERIYSALQKTRIMAPSTNCLSPIGIEAILSGMFKGVKAEFFTASTRHPTVYRGNPFQIEVGLAYGGQLGSGLRENGKDDAVQARVLRFANRVPLLYRQSACCAFKAVLETRWGQYGLSQSRGALPQAPVVILVHMASVWVPFTSESKEAIADYDEIRKEIKLAISETSRRLGMYLRRKKKRTAHSQRRDVFTRYIDEVVRSVRAMTVCDKQELRHDLVNLAEKFTANADLEFDEHGKVVKDKPVRERQMENTIIIDADSSEPEEQQDLFDGDGGTKIRKTAKRAKKTKRK